VSDTFELGLIRGYGPGGTGSDLINGRTNVNYKGKD
jgi:hypothetical protein